MSRASWLLLAACTADVEPEGPATPPAAVDPDQPGPYDVGVITRTLERPAPLRPLTIEVWYPAAVEEPDEGEVYHPLLRLPVGATREATPDLREALPIVLFSHGFGGVRFQSAFLTEWLAAHGFVVVAPDHPRNSLLELHVDEAAEVAARRPADLAHALDWLLAGGDGLGLAAGVDPAAVAVVGHSFGAFTSLVSGGGAFDPDGFEARCAAQGGRACAFVEGQALDRELVATWGVPDPRVRAIVPIAPGGWYAFGEDGAGLGDVVPSLVVAGTLDDELPYDTEALPVWQALGPPSTLVTLDSAGHWAFTDLCGFLPLADCAGAAGGFLDPAEVHAHTRLVVTAFLRGALRGEALEGWLVDEGPRRVSAR